MPVDHHPVVADATPTVVYNFAVEEDESYVAEGRVVHNCACSPPIGIPAPEGPPQPGKRRSRLAEALEAWDAETNEKLRGERARSGAGWKKPGEE